MLQLSLAKPHSLFTIQNLFDELSMLPQEENFRIVEPTYDIIENDNEYLIDFNLAGIKKEDVTVDIDEKKLKIKAERKEGKDLKYNRKESYFGVYEKSFVLSNTIDKKNIEASFTDGILTLKVPKIKETKNDSFSIKIK